MLRYLLYTIGKLWNEADDEDEYSILEYAILLVLILFVVLVVTIKRG